MMRELWLPATLFVQWVNSAGTDAGGGPGLTLMSAGNRVRYALFLACYAFLSAKPVFYGSEPGALSLT